MEAREFLALERHDNLQAKQFGLEQKNAHTSPSEREKRSRVTIFAIKIQKWEGIQKNHGLNVEVSVSIQAGKMSNVGEYDKVGSKSLVQLEIEIRLSIYIAIMSL